ncbi:MAG: diguanylate cyclase [Nakamurella sp.]
MTAPEALDGHDGETTGWEAEPSPRHPHVALLFGGTLLVVVLAGVVPLFVVQNVRDGAPRGLLILTVVVTLLCGIGPLATHQLQNTRYVACVLVLLDLLPLVLAASLTQDAPVRQWSSLLLIPVLIAAATLPPRWYQAELIAGCVVGTVILIDAANGAEEGLLTSIGFTLFMVICASLARRDRAALDVRFLQWQRRSRTDELTGLLNRRGFVAEFPEVRRLCLAAGEPVGVVMIDIDHFSRINEAHGNAYGDTVLQRICALVAELPELAGGLAARIGGEELIVVVPRPAEPVALALEAELARASVHPGLTVSMGICDAEPAECADPDAMWRVVTLADAAMYRAKELGRSRHVRAAPRGGAETSATPSRRSSRAATPQPIPRWSPAVSGPALPVVSLRDDLDPVGADEPTDARLFGAYCVVFAVIGLMAWAIPVAIDTSSRWVPVFLVGVTAMALLGLLALARGRRTPPVVTVVSCVVIELSTLSAVLATADVEQRLMIISILTVPVLVSAHAMPLPWLGSQIVLVFVGVGLAASSPGTPLDAAWMQRTLGLAAVISAAPGVLFWLRQRREEANRRLRRLVAIDPLTGVFNRVGLEHEVLRDLGGETVRVQAYNIDGFKALNDTYGHVFGDEVLAHLASTLAGTVAATLAASAPVAGWRPPLVGRTGGDRFIVIDRDPATPALTDRLRRAVRAFPVEVSVSVGEAVGPVDDAAGVWALIARAEAALVRPTAPRRSGPGGVATGTGPLR